MAHMPTMASLSPGAVGKMETDFDEVEQELRTAAAEQMAGRGVESWGFERREGQITEELLAVAKDISAAEPDATVVIVVGARPSSRTGWSAPSPWAWPATHRCPW